MTVRALRDSGSDLAVSAYAPTRRGHAFPVSERVQALHSDPSPPRLRRHLPRSAGQHRVRRPVFRRRAYDDHGWAFPDLACPDDAHSVAAYRLGVGRRRPHPRRSPAAGGAGPLAAHPAYDGPRRPARLRGRRRRRRRPAAGPAVRGLRRRGAGRPGGAVPGPGLAMHRRVLGDLARGRRPPPRQRRRRVAAPGAGVPQGAERVGHRRRPRAGTGFPHRRPADRPSLPHHRRAQGRRQRRGRRLRPRLGGRPRR